MSAITRMEPPHNVHTAKSSLESASKNPDAYSEAIYLDQINLAGYIIFDIDEETRQWKIYRFMIERDFQGM